jgi:hypothetical protein
VELAVNALRVVIHQCRSGTKGLAFSRWKSTHVSKRLGLKSYNDLQPCLLVQTGPSQNIVVLMDAIGSA